jgi:hypothetical protein
MGTECVHRMPMSMYCTYRFHSTGLDCGYHGSGHHYYCKSLAALSSSGREVLGRHHCILVQGIQLRLTALSHARTHTCASKHKSTCSATKNQSDRRSASREQSKQCRTEQRHAGRSDSTNSSAHPTKIVPDCVTPRSCGIKAPAERKEKKRARLNISVPHVCPDPVLANDRFRWPSHKRRFQLTATTARRVERAHSRPSDCIHHKDRGWIHSRDVQELVLVRTQLGESEPCCCCFVVQQHQKKRFLSAAAQCFVRTNTFLLLLLLPRDRNTN